MSNEATKTASCQTAVSGSAFSIHDLKCGNILNYDTAEGEILPTVIDWQDLKWLTEDPKGFNLVHSPIPLTEEWLLKFGFIKQKSTYIKTYSKRNEKSKIWFSLREASEHQDYNKLHFREPKKWWTFDNNYHSIKIEYVHQLQNLYCALTQTELQLTEK